MQQCNVKLNFPWTLKPEIFPDQSMIFATFVFKLPLEPMANLILSSYPYFFKIFSSKPGTSREMNMVRFSLLSLDLWYLEEV